ncbi:conjugation system SOS inhibitor PsiB [Atlantibacter subterraneus]|uniref:conjugation system SOS inhibitor PsiB n=1 Tax=Atlantibacter subterraneus TaxID=255519 RepID=UPI002FDE8A64
MRNIITLDVLKTMIPCEFEDYRNGGNDLRHALTHAVLRRVTAPGSWNIDCEYHAEFGGLFPVQCRFTPAHEHFHIVLCSPGDISPVWLMVFVSDNGHPVAVVRTLEQFSPELISHTLSLTDRLDSDGYPADCIIRTLAMEGAK